MIASIEVAVRIATDALVVRSSFSFARCVAFGGFGLCSVAGMRSLPSIMKSSHTMKE